MWCCKDPTEPQGTSIEDSDEDEDDDQSGVSALEIKEWIMTLRENIICLDEYNVRGKKRKIEALEQIEANRRRAKEKEIDAREQELLFQQKLLEDTRLELEYVRTREEELEAKEQEISLKRQALDDLENDIKDRNGVLEIVVRLNEKEQKIALQLQNLKAVQSDQVETDLNFAREKELEEKEQELFLRQRELEEREFEIDEKNDALDMAIQVKDFRHETRFRGFDLSGNKENNPQNNFINSVEDESSESPTDSLSEPST